jgi:2-polyprenyl-3-methyl-5-hydroxy-6-metoxy-1,4-benzoquinol methylase
MAIDHSTTYRHFSLRNIPHIARLRSIEKAVEKFQQHSVDRYYDVGCSNGYITHRVAKLLSAKKVTGWDHSEENLRNAAEQYPDYEFEYINLNVHRQITTTADFVTCFETIEHVGDIQAAIDNIDQMTSEKGIILYTVPIESGYLGSLKYLLKTKIFGYTLDEVTQDRNKSKQYEKSLFRGEDISIYRDDRDGWGTHFGFDYRSLEKILVAKYKNINRWTVGTSRFILIKKSTK